MMKGAQTAGAHVFSKGLCVAHHFWRIAYQTDRGRHDQESHDQQKPPTIVNMPDRELVEQGKPEGAELRSEEHTSELQSLMRISYAVFCLKKKKHNKHHKNPHKTTP